MRPASMAHSKENNSQIENVFGRLQKMTLVEKSHVELMEVKAIENERLLQLYAGSVLSQLQLEEQTKPKFCLNRHGIPANMRAKMVDWMIEVISSYKFS